MKTYVNHKILSTTTTPVNQTKLSYSIRLEYALTVFDDPNIHNKTWRYENIHYTSPCSYFRYAYKTALPGGRIRTDLESVAADNDAMITHVVDAIREGRWSSHVFQHEKINDMLLIAYLTQDIDVSEYNTALMLQTCREQFQSSKEHVYSSKDKSVTYPPIQNTIDLSTMCDEQGRLRAFTYKLFLPAIQARCRLFKNPYIANVTMEELEQVVEALPKNLQLLMNVDVTLPSNSSSQVLDDYSWWSEVFKGAYNSPFIPYFDLPEGQIMVIPSDAFLDGMAELIHRRMEASFELPEGHHSSTLKCFPCVSLPAPQGLAHSIKSGFWPGSLLDSRITEAQDLYPHDHTGGVAFNFLHDVSSHRFFASIYHPDVKHLLEGMGVAILNLIEAGIPEDEKAPFLLFHEKLMIQDTAFNEEDNCLFTQMTLHIATVLKSTYSSL